MKLFHWPYAKSLQLYSTGDIIVMAETVEQARASAGNRARRRPNGDPWLRGHEVESRLGGALSRR